MVFLVREILTEEDWAAWRELAAQRERIARKKHRRSIRGWLGNKLCGIVNTLFGILTLCAVVSGGMKAAWAIWGLILMIGGLWIFLAAGRCPAREKACSPGRDFPPSGIVNLPIRAVFFEDGYFAFWDTSGKTRLRYSSILRAWEDMGRFYLFFQDRSPLVLPKRGFVRCIPENFRDLLERELGRPVERLTDHQGAVSLGEFPL